MAVKTPETREDQDSAYNPGEQHARELSAYSSAGADQAEAFANDPANATKEQEENPHKLNYTGGSPDTKQPSGFRAQLKKKGPLGAILGLIIGGGGILGLLLTPSLAVVHMKEVFTEDLNDQLAAMDLRTTHVFKAKLKTLGTAGCSVKIKCKFKGMSDRQIKKFKAAGIDVDTTGQKNLFGRNIVKSLTFTDSSGNKIGPISDPNRISGLLGDRNIRNQIRKAFNPKFAGFYDKVSTKVFARYKTNKANKLDGKDKEAMKKNIDDAVAGHGAGVDPPKAGSDTETEEQRLAREAAEEQTDRIKTGSGFKSVFTSGLKGVGVLGAADTACTVYNTSRAVSALAKAVRAAQLAAYAMVFLNFADQVKAGEATPEQAEFVGDLLTKTDTQTMVINEESVVGSDGKPKEVKNPDYGKAAFDSEGAKAAYYNDAPTLSARAQQFSLGGGLLGTLSGVNEMVKTAIPGDEKEACGWIQSPWVRGPSLIVGIIGGIFSGGALFYVSIGASLAIGLALPILEGYLADMIAGTVVDGDTSGVDAGNAIFSGSAALMGTMAMGRGMKPLKKDEIKNYQELSMDVKDEYIALETEGAKKTPFDIYNQYSFLGSFARKVLPATQKSGSMARSSLSNLASLISIASGSTIPTAGAVGEWNPARFEKCEDPGYEELKIDADIFCNVRYGLSSKELAMDTDAVVDYMHPKYIDDDGNPLDKYAEFIKNCVERTDGWGETSSGDADLSGDVGSDGKECVEPGTYTANELSNFRVYTMDNSIVEAMEYEGEAVTESTSGTSGDVQWPEDKKYWDSNRTDWLDPHLADSGTWTSGTRRLAVDIGGGGRAVYAMLGGTVSKPDLGGHGLAIKSKVQGGTLEIAYAHGERENQKTSYSAGEKIMVSGCLGNCFGAHLHIDMAFNGKGVCPQLVFPLIESGEPINWADLAAKSRAPCG